MGVTFPFKGRHRCRRPICFFSVLWWRLLRRAMTMVMMVVGTSMKRHRRGRRRMVGSAPSMCRHPTLEQQRIGTRCASDVATPFVDVLLPRFLLHTAAFVHPMRTTFHFFFSLLHFERQCNILWGSRRDGNGSGVVTTSTAIRLRRGRRRGRRE